MRRGATAAGDVVVVVIMEGDQRDKLRAVTLRTK